jgi:hypothetical protein
MKTNWRLTASFGATLTVALMLAGCTDEGSVLAEESSKYAICTLDEGQDCHVQAPTGVKVERTALTADGDAIRVLSTVSSRSDCEGFATHAKPRSPKYVAQAVVNDTVVTPYGEMPHGPSVQTACATPPYRVALTVAKAP